MINTFYKNYPNKPIATSCIDIALQMARPTVKLTEPLKATKQKQGQPANSANKQAKKN